MPRSRGETPPTAVPAQVLPRRVLGAIPYHLGRVVRILAQLLSARAFLLVGEGPWSWPWQSVRFAVDRPPANEATDVVWYVLDCGD